MFLETLAGFTIGLHLASTHYPVEPWQENFNPGVYVSSPEGYSVGAYRNSLGRISVYGARTFTWAPFSISVGLISGYQREEWTGRCSDGGYSTPGNPCYLGSTKGPIGLMLAPSVKLEGIPFRLTFIPGIGTASALHLSIETVLP